MPRQRIGSVAYAIAATDARNVVGGVVEASSVVVGGQTVIDGSGRLTGAAAYAPGSGLQVVDNEIGLQSGCSAGEVLKWDGSVWACAADTSAPITGGAGISVTGPADAPTVSLSSDLNLQGTTSFAGPIAFASQATSGLRIETAGTQPVTCDAAHGGYVCFDTARGSLGICDGTRFQFMAFAPQSCLAIRRQDPAAPSGVYRIDPDGNGAGAPFQAYCDMETDGGGWTLVYKINSGVAGNAADLWQRTSPVNEGNTSLLGTGKSASHYVNRIVTGLWNQGGFSMDEARLHVYVGGVLTRYLSFNAGGTDRLSWFAPGRLTGSSWTDLAAGPINFFSISGDTTVNRQFFVSRSYGGCNVDAGWLVADTLPDSCGWETLPGAPLRLLYAAANTHTTWSAGAGHADVFAVFVR